MYVCQPAGPNKNYWFSGSQCHLALLSECAASMHPGLAVILHLKYEK